jgi:hypothetical protein
MAAVQQQPVDQAGAGSASDGGALGSEDYDDDADEMDEEYYDDDSYEYSDYYSISDDELGKPATPCRNAATAATHASGVTRYCLRCAADWDPDRERVLRQLRKSASEVSTPVRRGAGGKSLAERRREYRAARETKSMKELVAARRAQTDTAEAHPPALTPMREVAEVHTPPPGEVTMMAQGSDTGNGGSCSSSDAGNGSSREEGKEKQEKQKRPWPWRGR